MTTESSERWPNHRARLAAWFVDLGLLDWIFGLTFLTLASLSVLLSATVAGRMLWSIGLLLAWPLWLGCWLLLVIVSLIRRRTRAWKRRIALPIVGAIAVVMLATIAFPIRFKLSEGELDQIAYTVRETGTSLTVDRRVRLFNVGTASLSGEVVILDVGCDWNCAYLAFDDRGPFGPHELSELMTVDHLGGPWYRVIVSW